MPTTIHISGHMTGANPTPRHKLLAARPHRVFRTAPPQFAIVPKQLSVWGNSTYGDCVSAEEAFAIACYSTMAGIPQRFVTEQNVIAWARRNGFLNGANLTDVMDEMAKNGMVDSDNNQNDDGPYAAVDYSDEAVLQNAIALGPIKLGMDSSALPSGAGNKQGWTAFGGRPGEYRNEDHCTGLCGYGPAGYLFSQLGVPLPSGVQESKPSYLHFTWGTIGVVDHDWIMSTVGESWLRNPTTLGITLKLDWFI